MVRNKFFWALILTLSFFAPEIFAQEVQRVTITVGEASKEKFTLEPKEVTVRPGKVEFTLVNKGAGQHRLGLKMGDKSIRAGSADGGQTAKTEVDLTPGEYEMSCSLTSGGSHKEKGMVGKLIVK